MHSETRRLIGGCLFLLLFLIVSCSLKETLKKSEVQKDFSQETSRLERLNREHRERSIRADSHLRLAFFYVNCRNPKMNYTRALQEMQSYLSLVPAGSQTDDFQNWHAVLRELDGFRNERSKMEVKTQGLQNQAEKLQITLEKAQEANKTLREEVASLKEMIEKLKSLDLRMEEKRHLIK